MTAASDGEPGLIRQNVHEDGMPTLTLRIPSEPTGSVARSYSPGVLLSGGVRMRKDKVLEQRDIFRGAILGCQLVPDPDHVIRIEF